MKTTSAPAVAVVPTPAHTAMDREGTAEPVAVVARQPPNHVRLSPATIAEYRQQLSIEPDPRESAEPGVKARRKYEKTAQAIRTDRSHLDDRLDDLEAQLAAVTKDRDREKALRIALEREVNTHRQRQRLLASHFDGLAAWVSMPTPADLRVPPIIVDD